MLAASGQDADALSLAPASARSAQRRFALGDIPSFQHGLNGFDAIHGASFVLLARLGTTDTNRTNHLRADCDCYTAGVGEVISGIRLELRGELRIVILVSRR